MTFITLLLALVFLSSAVGHEGPGCPSEHWQPYIDIDGDVFPPGTIKCYAYALEQKSNDVPYNELCLGVHPDAFPALLESEKVVDFIRNNILIHSDWFNVGYYVEKDGVVRDYLGNKAPSTHVLPSTISKPEGSDSKNFLALSSYDLQFFPFAKNAWTVCSVDIVPPKITAYTPPPIYAKMDCPEGEWERKNLGYATKCFKVHRPKLINRCRLAEACLEAHPSALPASIRTEEEKQNLKHMSGYVTDKVLYTGMHIPCDPAQQIDSSGQIRFIQVNGEPVPDGIPDSIDNYKSNMNTQYVVGYLYESILGNAGSVSGRIEDLPDRAMNAPILCEIYLSEVPKRKRCRNGYQFLKDALLCSSVHLQSYL